MKREELINKAKELGIKGISRMKKVDLEWSIYLKESVNDKLSITNEDVDVSLNVIDLNELDLTDTLADASSLRYKMQDISKEKQLWLIS